MYDFPSPRDLIVAITFKVGIPSLLGLIAAITFYIFPSWGLAITIAIVAGAWVVWLIYWKYLRDPTPLELGVGDLGDR